MRTIPRHYPRQQVRGDYRAMCAYCSGVYYRSAMLRDSDGQLRCPESDCRNGRSAGELDRLNAQGAASEGQGNRPGNRW